MSSSRRSVAREAVRAILRQILTSEMVNLISNIIRVPRMVHGQINAPYALKDIAFRKGLTLRHYAWKQAFAGQRQLGI